VEEGGVLWRLSLPSTAPALGLPGRQLVEWGGAQRWLAGAVEAQAVRARATELGGHAVAFRGGDRAAGVFQPLAAPLAVVHRRLKQAFDPAGIFNPGRLYPEF
jgi:glycolate oxidase FAD binding subunit